MDKKQAGAFTKALNNKYVKKYLNHSKLATSQEFKDLIQSSVEVYNNCGNWSTILERLQSISTTKYYTAYLSCVCFCTGLSYTVDNYQLRLIKSEESKEERSFITAIETFINNPDYHGNLKSLTGSPKKIVPTEEARPNVDVMSLRVPGSFGSGKRR